MNIVNMKVLSECTFIIHNNIIMHVTHFNCTVEEHKKKIAEKLNLLESAGEELEEPNEQTPSPSSDLQTTHNKEVLAEEESGSQKDDESSPQNEDSVAVKKVLGGGKITT